MDALTKGKINQIENRIQEVIEVIAFRIAALSTEQLGKSI